MVKYEEIKEILMRTFNDLTNYKIDCIPVGSNSIDDKIYCLRIFYENSKGDKPEQYSKKVQKIASQIAKIKISDDNNNENNKIFENLTLPEFEMPSDGCVGLFEFSSKISLDDLKKYFETIKNHLNDYKNNNSQKKSLFDF
ncbi:MAG: hypothetical protein KQA40_01210 [Candidatus Aenigmarchaeota archaeon]|nr:hypothetical protein [Candidatus Aenigmarchaeota archaeon]